MCIKVVQTTKLISFLNLCNFCTYQFFLQFPLFEDVIDVPAYNSSVTVEKCSHLLLRKPHCLVLQFYIERHDIILACVNYNWWCVEIGGMHGRVLRLACGELARARHNTSTLVFCTRWIATLFMVVEYRCFGGHWSIWVICKMCIKVILTTNIISFLNLCNFLHSIVWRLLNVKLKIR